MSELMDSEKSRLSGAALAVVSSLYFLVAAIASHMVNTQYNFFQDYISDYAVGQGGWIFRSAFLASFVACIALPFALWQIAPHSAILNVGLGLLASAGIASLVDFQFATDILPPGAPPVTLSGNIHLAAALIGWIAFVVAALIISYRLKRVEILEKWIPSIIALAWLSIVLLLVLFAVVAVKIPFGGLAEKLFVLDRNFWMLLVSGLIFWQARQRRR
jgi:hypothetical protein